MRKILLLLIVVLTTIAGVSAANKTYKLSSPNKKICVEVAIKDGSLSYLITDEGTVLLDQSKLSMELLNGKVLGENISRTKRSKYTSINMTSPSPFYICQSVVDHCKQLQLWFADNYSVIFRAYDNGVAYRFVTDIKGEITVVNETAYFNLPYDAQLYASHANTNAEKIEDQYFNSFERFYVAEPISKQDPEQLILTPLLSETNSGRKVLITETDLDNYPGMFLLPDSENSAVKGVYAPVPTKCVQGGHNDIQMLVEERADYIAKCDGVRSFPWRIVAVSRNDCDLLDNHLAYLLATPSVIEDVSWIKPGMVAWDWWCDWNLTGVDFKAGVNNQTYKYFIDFASKNQIEYIILDEGWAHPNYDLLSVVPEIDIKELVDYGAQRSVGVILWAGYYGIATDTERVVSHYSAMGVKGFKIDFFDRDDQPMVESTRQIAEVCAKYHMVLDLHGFPKPSGVQRTYPNILNFEGVSGLEQLKWCDEQTDMVRHDVIFPYVRMFNGQVDYTQGAMRNTIKGDYHPMYSNPVSQGTRCRQLGAYVVFFSPLNMLCDSPTQYELEPAMPELIHSIPTVWDETVPVAGAIGESIVVARRSGENWYLGGLINWEPCDIDVSFDFLGEGEYNLEIYCDGVNADRNAADYRIVRSVVNNQSSCTVECMPGGGFVAKIIPIK